MKHTFQHRFKGGITATLRLAVLIGGKLLDVIQITPDPKHMADVGV
jgi:hypothetical protein